MGKSATPARLNSKGELTRRRIIDAAIEAVIEVGYYKASSNEIARRAGVSWSSIQHLFGSRELLMLEVLRDVGGRRRQRFASEPIEGVTLEERLASVHGILARYFEQSTYLVQVLILFDLSVNPKVTERDRLDSLRSTGRELAGIFAPALGGAAGEEDLVLFAYTALSRFVASREIARLGAGIPDDTAARDFLIRGIALVIREEASRRGLSVD